MVMVIMLVIEIGVSQMRYQDEGRIECTSSWARWGNDVRKRLSYTASILSAVCSSAPQKGEQFLLALLPHKLSHSPQAVEIVFLML